MPSKVLKMALGCFKPQDQERRTSRDLEKKLSQWMKNYNKAIKILLLGAGESGKTTIIKQMKILHIQGFSESERQDKVREIRANVLECIVMLVRQMEVLGISIRNKFNAASLDYIRNIDLTQDFEYSIEFFEHVRNLWEDEGLQECYERGPEFQLPDCSKYFLDRVSQVGDPVYRPSDEDILHSRRTTCDIQKIEFSMTIPKKYGGGTQNFWMFDVGGQRGERRKWIQVFDGIHTIQFLVACNTFDQFLPEDPTVNRLQESINLFQDVWSSRFLQDSGFIIFLNKQDLLKQKIESGVSIGQYFPEYVHYRPNNGREDYGNEYLRTRSFIRDLFLTAKEAVSQAQATTPRRFSVGPAATPAYQDVHRLKRECFCHYTTATSTENIEHVFKDVHHMIINQHLETLGLA